MKFEMLTSLLEQETRCGIKFLTNEAKVLILIKSEPGKSVKYYLTKTNLSYKGFYNILAVLEDHKMIKFEKSEFDRRNRFISLVPSADWDLTLAAYKP